MSRNYSSTAIDTTLTSGVSPANTTLAVAATTGFPAAPFVLAVDAGAASQELVLVTAVGGLSLTVTRGYDSTVAATHESGAKVSHSHAAIDFREAGTHIDATAAHGATGAVVGTTNTQTLTNKTLTAPTLTAPVATGSLAGFGEAWTTYAPVLTALTTNPTLGNSTLAGKYLRIGKLLHFHINLTIGSTFSAGSGAYFFSLPPSMSAIVPMETGIGTAVSVAAGRRGYVVDLFNTTTVLLFRTADDVNLDHLGAGVAWAAGHTVGISGICEVA